MSGDHKPVVSTRELAQAQVSGEQASARWKTGPTAWVPHVSDGVRATCWVEIGMGQAEGKNSVWDGKSGFVIFSDWKNSRNEVSNFENSKPTPKFVNFLERLLEPTST